LASKPNGHALAFAEAFQGMVYDTVKPMIDGLDEKLNGRMDSLEGRFNQRMDGIQEQLNTTNENMQIQLAQHRKDISNDVRKIVKRGG
jgi:hypothetical protein